MPDRKSERWERAREAQADPSQLPLDAEWQRYPRATPPSGSPKPGGEPQRDAAGGAEGPQPAQPAPRLDQRQNNSTQTRRGDPKRRSRGPCRFLPPNQVSLRGPDSKRIPMRCKRWTCPDCGPWLRNRLVDSIAEAAERHSGLRRFVTLTLPRKRGWDAERAWRRLGRMQAALAERMAREWGERPTYIWVREPHRDGWPHVHLLIDRYVPKGWLQQAWSSVGGGWTDIRFVDLQRVAAYVAKYMAKSPPELPRGTRRYGSTRNVTLKVYPKGDGTWQLEAWDPDHGWVGMGADKALLHLLRHRWPRHPDRPPDWSVLNRANL